MTTQTNPTSIDTAKNVFRVLETGDLELAFATVAPTFRNREASVSPAAASLAGPAGLLASGVWMRSAFSDLHFTVTDAISDDRRVWLRLRMSGRHTGAFVQFNGGKLAQAVPPTGREIDFEQIHVLEFADGKVVSHEAVRDDITMLGQLGVFPPAPATALRMAGWSVSGRSRRAAAAVSDAASRAAMAAI